MIEVFTCHVTRSRGPLVATQVVHSVSRTLCDPVAMRCCVLDAAIGLPSHRSRMLYQSVVHSLASQTMKNCFAFVCYYC